MGSALESQVGVPAAGASEPPTPAECHKSAAQTNPLPRPSFLCLFSFYGQVGEGRGELPRSFRNSDLPNQFLLDSHRLPSPPLESHCSVQATEERTAWPWPSAWKGQALNKAHSSLVSPGKTFPTKVRRQNQDH